MYISKMHILVRISRVFAKKYILHHLGGIHHGRKEQGILRKAAVP